MRRINIDQIVAGTRKLRFAKEELGHLMRAYEEPFSGLLEGLNINPGVITILTGSELSEGELTSGWGAYGGEIFQIDAVSIADDPGSQTYVWNITTSFESGPSDFDDGNQFNVNEIRKLSLSIADSGSGIADYADTAYLNDPWHPLTPEAGWSVHPGAPTSQLSNGIPSYRKDAFGNLYLVGALEAQDGLGSALMAVLPEGYRPERYLTIVGRSESGSRNLIIYPNGEIRDLFRDNQQPDVFYLTGVCVPLV